jgi:hypothetical protein
MQAIRSSKLMVSLVLAWFTLFLGASVASAVTKSDTLQMVCSAGGVMKWVDTDGGEGALKLGTGMDCPLCAGVSVPLPTAISTFEKPSPLAHALQTIAAAHIASSTAPPLPSRGPPSVS